jgi:hypothetical protein
MPLGTMMLPPIAVSLPFKLRAGGRLEPGRGQLGAELRRG